MATYTLPRIERLHYKKDIDELLATGKGFVAYPLRVVYTTLPRRARRAFLLRCLWR